MTMLNYLYTAVDMDPAILTPLTVHFNVRPIIDERE